MTVPLKIPRCYAPFANDPIFLVDTDILSEIAKGGISKQTEIELLSRKTILLYSVTSIMELGFGPSHSIPKEELDFYRSLYAPKSRLNPLYDLVVTEFSIKHKLGQLDSARGNWISICPDSNNWFAAKNSLIMLMDVLGTTPKNAKDLQIDMLLSCAAWNARAFIWTNNIKDHLLASYYTNYNIFNKKRKLDIKTLQLTLAKNITPVFDTSMMNKMIAGEDFNVYSELKTKVKSKEIIDVLEIAEKYPE